MNNGKDNANGNGHAYGNGQAYVPGDYATTLANDGIDTLNDTAGRICRNERERIESANRPATAAAKAEHEVVTRELHDVAEEVAKLPPEGELRSRRRRALGELLDSLGIPRRGLHAFRHLNGSLMDRFNVPVKVRQERLGHSTAMMTLDHYTHAVSEDDRRIAARLGRVLRPLVPKRTGNRLAADNTAVAAQ